MQPVLIRDFDAAAVGAVVGIVVGLTTMGGGALLTPALIFLGIPPSMAIGSDFLIASGTKLFGSGAYVMKRRVHWPTVGRLCLGSIPGAFVGDRILASVGRASLDSFVTYGLGTVLIIAGSATLYRLRMKGPRPDLAMPSTWVMVLLGFMTGVLVTGTSVGSGSLLIVFMIRLVPLPLNTLIGTDLLHALILTSLATVLHGIAGRVDVHLAASVLVGTIPGVLVGARLAGTLPERALRGAVAGVLVFVGFILLSRGTAGHPTPQVAAAHSSTVVSSAAGAPVIAAEIRR